MRIALCLFISSVSTGCLHLDARLSSDMFFSERYADHRDLHSVDRRQRQMCIRERIAAGSEGAVLHGDLEHEYRRATINTFGGGVVEVLRGLVATHGLGMPTHR